MKRFFIFCIVALHMLVPDPSKAQPAGSIDRVLQCGYLIAKANTVALVTEQFFIERQNISLYNTRLHRSWRVDLDQHFSANGSLDGRKILDLQADWWFCLRAKTGRQYLYIAFTCANPDSRSCEYGSEEGRVYDDAGRDLDIGKMTDAQSAALYKRLGLPSEKPNGGYMTPSHNIFLSQ